MTTTDDARVDHRLLEYESTEQFTADVTPFLFEGLPAGDPGLVVASVRNITAVQDRLGSDADQLIRFVDADSWGSGNVPARVLAIDWAMRKLLATAYRCRYVGEFTWRGDEQLREWHRHEAVANVLHPVAQSSMLCAADTRTIPPEFLKDLRQTHPIIAPAQPNPDFVEPWTYLTTLDSNKHRPAPPHADTTTAVAELVIAVPSARPPHHVSDLSRGPAARPHRRLDHGLPSPRVEKAREPADHDAMVVKAETVTALLACVKAQREAVLAVRERSAAVLEYRAEVLDYLAQTIADEARGEQYLILAEQARTRASMIRHSARGQAG